MAVRSECHICREDPVRSKFLDQNQIYPRLQSTQDLRKAILLSKPGIFLEPEAPNKALWAPQNGLFIFFFHMCPFYKSFQNNSIGTSNLYNHSCYDSLSANRAPPFSLHYITLHVCKENIRNQLTEDEKKRPKAWVYFISISQELRWQQDQWRNKSSRLHLLLSNN